MQPQWQSWYYEEMILQAAQPYVQSTIALTIKQ